MPADRVGNDVVRIVQRPFSANRSTRTAMWSLETEMFHNSPIPRTESRCRASQECCSMTKKTRPSYSQRVGHLHVARTSTYLRTRRFPSAVVSFSFEKTVLTHISCRDGATVNTIFLSLLRLLDSRAHLQSPFTEVSHWLCSDLTLCRNT